MKSVRQAIRRGWRDAWQVVPPTGQTPSSAWFAAPVCRNCGADLQSAHCGACGQKAARRLEWRDIRKETWERLRFFELGAVKTAARLLLAPGLVAREFVLGRRGANIHPLKLLVALVAVLILILAANRYFNQYQFSGENADVKRMAERVMAYGNWSFSLGIFAIFAGSWLVFRGRLGYNFIEHAVLAIYGQCAILAVVILNLVPTLIWNDPDFILWHKRAAQVYLFVVKVGIVGGAYHQFLRLDWKSDWPKFVVACLIYASLSWLLLRLYALAILWLVTAT